MAANYFVSVCCPPGRSEVGVGEEGGTTGGKWGGGCWFWGIGGAGTVRGGM